MKSRWATEFDSSFIPKLRCPFTNLIFINSTSSCYRFRKRRRGRKKPRSDWVREEVTLYPCWQKEIESHRIPNSILLTRNVCNLHIIRLGRASINHKCGNGFPWAWKMLNLFVKLIFSYSPEDPRNQAPQHSNNPSFPTLFFFSRIHTPTFTISLNRQPVVAVLLIIIFPLNWNIHVNSGK